MVWVFVVNVRKILLQTSLLTLFASQFSGKGAWNVAQTGGVLPNE